MSETARCPECGTLQDMEGEDAICRHCGGDLTAESQVQADVETAALGDSDDPGSSKAAAGGTGPGYGLWALGAAALVLLVGVFMVGLGGTPPGPAMSVAEYLKLGNDLYAQGRFAEAAEEYQQALRVDGGSVSARVNLGNAYYALDRLDQAAEAFRAALKAAPNDADVHSNLAAVLFRQGAVDSALTEAQAAVNLKPDLAEGHYLLGVVYQQKGDKPRALAEFQRTLALTSDARLKAETEAIIAQLARQ